VKTIAETGRDEIDGQPVDYWLEILNQDSPPVLSAKESMVLSFAGRDYFFVSGKVVYLVYNLKGSSSGYSMRSCFLIAVGEAAVGFLSKEETIFRKIAGTDDLAAFSIYRWPDFLRQARTAQ
jgi:hypothetical protein